MPVQDLPQSINIPEFRQIVLHTGNLMRTSVAGNNKSLMIKTNTELSNAIADTLKTSLRSSMPSFQYHVEGNLLEVPDIRQRSGIPPEDRDNVEVTAKLFYLDNVYPTSHIDAALQHVLKLLNVQSFDHLIVSFGRPVPPASSDVWNTLGEYHRQGVFNKLGVSDFTPDELSDILANTDVRIKPSFNQIHMNQYNEAYAAFMDLAKLHNIELLHNGDRADIINDEILTMLLRDFGVIGDAAKATPRWVLKYHVFVKCRSIVTDKGYIVVGDVPVA